MMMLGWMNVIMHYWNKGKKIFRFPSIHHSIIPIFLLLLSSCEKDFVMPEPEGASKLVVNCRLDNQRVFKVYLSESTPPNTQGQLLPVTDAVVELYKNGSLQYALPFVYTDSAQTFGCYIYPEMPEPGNKYSVLITHSRYGFVSAQDVVPTMPKILSYQLLQLGDSTNDYKSRYRFTFQDEGTQENFYRLNIWQYGRRIFVPYNTTDTIYDVYGSSSSPEVSVPLQDSVREYTSLLFSDKGFNGQTKEIDFTFRGYPLHFVTEGNIVVEMVAVSKANYNYFKTLEQYRTTPSGYDPVPLYSNINNGYGIFMGEAINSMWTRIK